MRFTSVYKPRARAGRDDPWLIAVSLPGGRRYVTGTRSRGDTERLADRLGAIAERIAVGLDTPAALDAFLAARKALSDSLSDYHDWLYAVGRTRKHADQMYFYCVKLLAGIDTVYHLTGPLVEKRIAAISGSSNTRKRYLDALKAFLSWGWRDRRWSRDAMDCVAAVRVKAQRERRRRVLPPDELAKLIAVADKHEPAIATVYLVTLAAALRAGELPHVSIFGQHVKVAANKTKNRRGVWARLPAALADRAGAVHWSRLNPANMARRLRRDLAEAGIEYETPAGVFDFHALRHQSGAMLALAGVNPKAIQNHMRHGSIRMTLDTYGHLMDADRRATAQAVDAMVLSARGAAETEVSQMCGTSNAKPTDVTPDRKWSDGESNPDLLNAIQPSTVVISLIGNELRDKRSRPVARGAAARLLARLYAAATRRAGR